MSLVKEIVFSTLEPLEEIQDMAPRNAIRPLISLTDEELRKKVSHRLNASLAASMSRAELLAFLDGE